MQGFTLRSGETLPVYWIPSDPSDSNVYYPQSVFRNGLTGALIATVDLTRQSDGSYTNTLLVPNDPTNLGMYIVETLNVYTDTNHTVLTGIYAQEQRTHKIKNETQNFGGASVDTTDYNYIEKVVKKIVEEAITKIRFEQKDVDFSSINEQFSKMNDRKTRHRKMMMEISDRVKALEEKEITFPQGEYGEHFMSLANLVGEHIKGVNERIDGLDPIIKGHLDGQHIADHEAFHKSHTELKERIDGHLKGITDEMKHRFEGVDYMAYRRGYEPEEKKKESDYLKGLI